MTHASVPWAVCWHAAQIARQNDPGAGESDRMPWSRHLAESYAARQDAGSRTSDE